MKIILITQNEHFYLREALDHLFHELPNDVEISCCVLLPSSPLASDRAFSGVSLLR